MITVVGMDCAGNAASRVPPALAAATLVVGAQRHLDAMPLRPGARAVALGDVGAALDAVAAHDGDVVVLASGDPGLFGVLRTMTARGVPPDVVVPAVSSVAAAFARIGEPWDDAVVVSAHGRDPGPAVSTCLAWPKVAVLTEPRFGPAALGAALAGSGRRLVVAEHLGTAQERITECQPEEAAERVWADPNVVLVLDPAADRATARAAGARPAAPEGWALDESAFEHRDSMVTKAEVRALVLARLAPRLGTMVWDVGAGSGSVAIECARFNAAVVAVERDPAQCLRIAANAARHGAQVRIVPAAAPGALADLAQPDAVYVGGGGLPVIAAVAERRPARVVAGLAALDRVGPAQAVLAASGYQVQGVLLQAARLAGLPDGSSRLAATNPVIVLSAVLT